MHPNSVDECRRYVESELDRVVRSQPGWFATPAIMHAEERPPAAPKSEVTAAWRIRQGSESWAPWYLLEASMDEQEFRIWFGNHHVGMPGPHWIMRPAIHVSFDSLTPMQHPFDLRLSLGDVLETMISAKPRDDFHVGFEPNTFSLT